MVKSDKHIAIFLAEIDKMNKAMKESDQQIAKLLSEKGELMSELHAKNEKIQHYEENERRFIEHPLEVMKENLERLTPNEKRHFFSENGRLFNLTPTKVKPWQKSNSQIPLAALKETA